MACTACEKRRQKLAQQTNKLGASGASIFALARQGRWQDAWQAGKDAADAAGGVASQSGKGLVEMAAKFKDDPEGFKDELTQFVKRETPAAQLAREKAQGMWKGIDE